MVDIIEKVQGRRAKQALYWYRLLRSEVAGGPLNFLAIQDTFESYLGLIREPGKTKKRVRRSENCIN